MPSNLKELQAKDRLQSADLSRATYIEPRGNGTHLVQLPSGAQVIVSAASGRQSFAPGETVLIGTYSGDQSSRVLIGRPPSTGRGSAIFGAAPGTTATSQLAIVLQVVPDELAAGAVDLPVYLIGVGLLETPVTGARAVVLDGDGLWTDDPLVTLHNPQWIADPAGEGLTVAEGLAVVRVLADVDASAPIGYTINVQPVAGDA